MWAEEICFLFSIIHGTNILGIMDELKKVYYVTAYEYSPSLDVNNSWLRKNNIVGNTTYSINRNSIIYVFNKLQLLDVLILPRSLRLF